MIDYFYNGYTILLCTGEVLVDVRRESLFTRDEVTA